ncbi:MAG: hypothetical protein KAT68_02840 [Bacteroidales bacterium]|nr:hypothetical protein [Bacteroidales bacterium]
MEKKVTGKSTKSEILEAYNEMLKEVESKTEDPQLKLQRETEAKTVKAVSSLSTEKIYKQTSELKMNITSALDKVEEQITIAFKEFENLQKAIKTENKNLEESYQISANAHSLSALLLAQKEKSEEFEKEINEKREKWENEEEQIQITLKETKALLEKERKREDEEYQYNLKLSRKKETDKYEEQKQLLEKQLTEKQINFDKEIAERETKVTEAENELIELRKKAEEFPKILEKEIAKVKKETEEKLKQQYDFEKQLKNNQIQGEQKLKEQNIENLLSRIKEQEVTIKQLSQKVNVSEESMKQMALKALDASGKERIVTVEKETVKEK